MKERKVEGKINEDVDEYVCALSAVSEFVRKTEDPEKQVQIIFPGLAISAINEIFHCYDEVVDRRETVDLFVEMVHEVYRLAEEYCKKKEIPD
jgi:hypothetical protein